VPDAPLYARVRRPIGKMKYHVLTNTTKLSLWRRMCSPNHFMDVKPKRLVVPQIRRVPVLHDQPDLKRSVEFRIDAGPTDTNKHLNIPPLLLKLKPRRACLVVHMISTAIRPTLRVITVALLECLKIQTVNTSSASTTTSFLPMSSIYHWNATQT
jgi:hypothetical protein